MKKIILILGVLISLTSCGNFKEQEQFNWTVVVRYYNNKIDTIYGVSVYPPRIRILYDYKNKYQVDKTPFLSFDDVSKRYYDIAQYKIINKEKVYKP